MKIYTGTIKKSILNLLMKIVVYYGATWRTFKAQVRKIKEINPEKIYYTARR